MYTIADQFAIEAFCFALAALLLICEVRLLMRNRKELLRQLD